jgi:hypothetical protein
MLSEKNSPTGGLSAAQTSLDRCQSRFFDRIGTGLWVPLNHASREITKTHQRSFASIDSSCLRTRAGCPLQQHRWITRSSFRMLTWREFSTECLWWEKSKWCISRCWKPAGNPGDPHLTTFLSKTTQLRSLVNALHYVTWLVEAMASPCIGVEPCCETVALEFGKWFS